MTDLCNGSHNCSVVADNGLPKNNTIATAEAAFGQTREFYQQILESSDDCIKVLDLEGRLLFMSPGGQALLKINDITPFLNLSWVDFWQGADREAAIKAIARAKAGGVFTFTGCRPILTGELKWWDNKLSPIKGASGQVEQLLCISRDITERRYAQERLIESETRYRALTDLSPDAILVNLNGQFIYANSVAVQLLGATQTNQIIGRTPFDFIEPQYHDLARERIKRLLLSQPIEQLIEQRWRRLDGLVIDVEVSAGTITWQGQPAVQVILRDIAERKRREANLAFLAEIGEDFSRLSTADEIMQVVGAKIGAYLNITTCNFTDVDEAQGEVTVHHGWNSPDVPSTVGKFRLNQYLSSEFKQASRIGETFVIRDTQTDPRTDAAGYAALNMHSFVTVPFHHNGRWTHYIAICDSRARDWRDDEIELIEEISYRIFPRLERARAEEALRKSEEKYRSLFNSMDEGFCIVQLLFEEGQKPIDYRFIEINPVFERQTGLNNALGRTVRELVPDLEQFWFDIYGQVALTGSPTRFVDHAKSMGRWFEVNAFRVGEPHERKVAVLFNDITERKKSEQERERFLALGSDFQVTTGMDGYFHWVSPSFEQLLGWTYEEMTSRPWTDFVHPEDINPSVSETDSLFKGKETLAFENRYRHKDGSYRWLLWNAQPYPEEQVIYGAAVDITKRKKAEAAIAADLRDTQLLRDLSARFTTESNIQVLYDEIVATAVALMRSDAGSFQVFDNATQELLFLASQGFSPTMASFFERISTNFNTSCGIALATGKRAIVDFDVPESVDPNGYRRIHFNEGLLSAQSTPLISRKGKLLGMVSTHWRHHHRPNERELRFLDLLARQAADLIEQRQDEAFRQKLLEQEQRAREEAERANRIKDEFLAVLSHELRSPLNPILGWSSLLLSRQLSDAQISQGLATIQRNAKLQSELIDDLLDVSRILRGKLSLNTSPVELTATIKAAMETVRLAASAKSINVQTLLEPNIGFVLGDSTRLQQVVWNLLSNAVKFTPVGGQVEVRLERVGKEAQIIVSDTGKGISPDFLPYVFDYFRQEDAATTRKFGGLGLGLAIVRHLVELHGGTVGAQSKGEGFGATFIVRLPLLPTQTTNHSPALHEGSSDLNGIRILVVDDETDTRDFTAFLLKQSGAQIVAVSSAAEAMSALKQSKFDVLLSDIAMPDVDGYTLIQKVRMLPAPDNKILALAVTAYAGEINQQQALDSGFNQHISKPIEPEALVQAISSLVWD